jgi:hypothetical protein
MAARMSLLALALATIAPIASAQITLISEQLRSGGGSWKVGGIADPSSYNNPTSWGAPVAFPDDDTNSTTIDPNGLHVKVTRTGQQTRSGQGQQGQTASWTTQDFKVVFRVDQPTPFSAHSTGGFGDSFTPFPGAGLYAEDRHLVFPVNAGFPPSQSGILPPGTYSFEGTAGEPIESGGGAVFRTFTWSSELTVGVPEPTCLPAAGIVATAALARRRRTSPAI